MRSTDILEPWPQGQPPAPEWCAEERRASILSAYGLDALEDDPELAQITGFAAKLCDAPIALVSLVEEERQRFLARAGLKERETPRPTSFCAHAMLEPEVMIVPDAQDDPRFSTNPLVTGHPYIRFYAGAPLVSHEGAPLGSLCIIDTEPRAGGLDEMQRDGLLVLAQSVMRRLRHRREHLEQLATREEHADRLQSMIDSVPDIAWAAAPGPAFENFNARWTEITGAAPPKSVDDWREFIHPKEWEASLAKFTAAVEKCEPFEDEWRLRLHDGTYRWVLSRAVPSSDDPATARWFGTLTDVHEARSNFERVDLLSRELSHRIKNIFAVITGLISIRARRAPEAREFSQELSESIRALSRAHDFVRPSDGRKGDSLKGLLAELLAPYGVGERITIEGADSPIGERSATPFALVFHELATNAAKYGALSGDAGCIRIDLAREGDEIVISWEETEVSPEDESRKEGFGSQLVRLAVEGQLGGSIERVREGDTLKVRLRVPAQAVQV